jgi:hypothetical protein
MPRIRPADPPLHGTQLFATPPASSIEIDRETNDEEANE